MAAVAPAAAVTTLVTDATAPPGELADAPRAWGSVAVAAAAAAARAARRRGGGDRL